MPVELDPMHRIGFSFSTRLLQSRRMTATIKPRDAVCTESTAYVHNVRDIEEVYQIRKRAFSIQPAKIEILGRLDTMKALRQFEYAQPLQVVDIPLPSAVAGTAVLRILAANIISYTKNIYNGVRKYPYPTPLTAGSSAIGRVHSLGPDSTSLKEGQLVVVDITFRSRDDPTDAFLSAIHEGHTPGSKKLMDYFRDGAYAEYMTVPLENCYPLNESILFEKLHYTLPDLLSIMKLMVPYGGLRDVNLLPHETVIIAPSTGGFGGAAVYLALSMGARVVAMGRNKDALGTLQTSPSKQFGEDRLITVSIVPEFGEQLNLLKSALKDFNCPKGADVFFDISPAEAAKSPHFKAAILSLRHSGRVSLMGGQREDVSIPHVYVMHFNLTIKGKWMYERQDIRDMIKLLENGGLRLGNDTAINSAKSRAFQLEDWAEAFDHAANSPLTMGVGAYFEVGT